MPSGLTNSVIEFQHLKRYFQNLCLEKRMSILNDLNLIRKTQSVGILCSLFFFGCLDPIVFPVDEIDDPNQLDLYLDPNEDLKIQSDYRMPNSSLVIDSEINSDQTLLDQESVEPSFDQGDQDNLLDQSVIISPIDQSVADSADQSMINPPFDQGTVEIPDSYLCRWVVDVHSFLETELRNIPIEIPLSSCSVPQANFDRLRVFGSQGELSFWIKPELIQNNYNLNLSPSPNQQNNLIYVKIPRLDAGRSERITLQIERGSPRPTPQDHLQRFRDTFPWVGLINNTANLSNWEGECQRIEPENGETCNEIPTLGNRVHAHIALTTSCFNPPHNGTGWRGGQTLTLLDQVNRYQFTFYKRQRDLFYGYCGPDIDSSTEVSFQMDLSGAGVLYNRTQRLTSCSDFTSPWEEVSTNEIDLSSLSLDDLDESFDEASETDQQDDLNRLTLSIESGDCAGHTVELYWWRLMPIFNANELQVSVQSIQTQ